MTSKHHNLGLENVVVGTFQRGCRLDPTALAKRKTTTLLFHACSTTHMLLVCAGRTRQRMQSDFRIFETRSSQEYRQNCWRLFSLVCKNGISNVCVIRYSQNTLEVTVLQLDHSKIRETWFKSQQTRCHGRRNVYEFHDTYNSKLHLKCMVVSPRRLFNLMRQFHHELNCDSIRRLFRLLSKRCDHMQKSMMKALLLDPIIYFNWTYRLWILLPCQHRRWQDDS